MKKMKRMAGFLLAVMMMVMMAAPAMAATGGDGTTYNGPATSDGRHDDPKKATITIKNPTKEATYTLYKVFDATATQGGEISYYYPVGETGKMTVEQFNAYCEGFFTVDAVGNITATAKAKDGVKLSADAKTWIEGHGLYIDNKTAAGSGQNTVVFENLSYGYYFVKSTVNDGAAITVTSTDPNAVIIDKNQGPGWTPDPTPTPTPDPDNPNHNIGKMIVVTDENGQDALVRVNSLNYNDKITFQISIDATNYDGENQIKKYYVIDRLYKGFTFDKIESIQIKDENGNNLITRSEVNQLLNTKTTSDGDYNKFVLGFDWADSKGEGENKTWTSRYPANTQIVIRYTATVNEGADIADANLNKAKFTYVYTDKDDDPKNPEDPQYPSSTEETTKTYVYSLAIKKVNETGAALSDAKFQIGKVDVSKLTPEEKAQLENKTLNLKTLSDDKIATIRLSQVSIADASSDTAPNVYKYDTNGSITEVITPKSGIIIIKGIEADDYIVKENEAPQGYTKLVAPEVVSAELQATYEAKIITYRNSAGEVVDTITEESEDKRIIDENLPNKVVPLVVKNTKGVLLPSTGGMGTTIFYIIGGILVIGAGVLLITKKRMSTK